MNQLLKFKLPALALAALLIAPLAACESDDGVVTDYLERYFSGRHRVSNSVEFMLVGSTSEGVVGRSVNDVWKEIQADAAYVVLTSPEARHRQSLRVRAGWPASK